MRTCDVSFNVPAACVAYMGFCVADIAFAKNQILAEQTTTDTERPLMQRACGVRAAYAPCGSSSVRALVHVRRTCGLHAADVRRAGGVRAAHVRRACGARTAHVRRTCICGARAATLADMQHRTAYNRIPCHHAQHHRFPAMLSNININAADVQRPGRVWLMWETYG